MQKLNVKFWLIGNFLALSTEIARLPAFLGGMPPITPIWGRLAGAVTL